MTSNPTILGIDIGSVSISVVELSRSKKILKSAYALHKGDVAGGLEKVLNRFSVPGQYWIAGTASTPAAVKTTTSFDNRLSLIEAVRYFHPETRSILQIGGEKFSLICFDRDGQYLSCRANTSCAAGTGSFLDQQADRLNLEGIQKLSRMASENKGQIPRIASRCSVFAKTDLVHAQQEGYTLAEICDGLCSGLAKNVVDTLFSGARPGGPMIVSGGVSRNRSVLRHIRQITGLETIADPFSYMYDAVGAALHMAAHIQSVGEEEVPIMSIASWRDLLARQNSRRRFYYPPLTPRHSEYPDFDSRERYAYRAKGEGFGGAVEVDVYKKVRPLSALDLYMGIDIGSTSTKAVLMEGDRSVVAGFYTRTMGRPVAAVSGLFEAMDDLSKRQQVDLRVVGAGTTGSGRKLIGKIIGADKILDEISAHARAAVEINRSVDTIIEIGGQDAKFTTLKNGMVTFSVMNHVCAAGTGSFIEEQARKLGCPLDEYSERTHNMPAPLSSDRCTVFMERDINHYLSEGYSVNEVLASVLHSVRENYLLKVAVESSIGNVILFQGATAKIRGLVTAFEQRLKKPIEVSKFCHLTGAMGIALLLADRGIKQTQFRGIELYKKTIPIRSEICSLCNNHCKLTVARMGRETVAYGFLCGREYDTTHYVNNNLSGFDLIRARRKAAEPESEKKRGKKEHRPYTIGIPAALHLFEDLDFWKTFFETLSIQTITSETIQDALTRGKQLSGAEFCAPITQMHGHVNALMDRSDYLFLPFYLEDRPDEKEVRRQFCYYTQYMHALAATSAKRFRKKLLTPVIKYLYTGFHTRTALYRMLKGIDPKISFFEVSSAYDRAVTYGKNRKIRLKALYRETSQFKDDVQIVFLGRPYTVLSPSMNKGIPDIFAALGIKAYFQDMLPYTREDVAGIAPLLTELHWKYGAKILESAEAITKRRGVYPVLVTAFKCTPDAFIKDAFKKIMEASGRPYLILELDEHDSSLGYETRIEAAIRSFRNDFKLKNKPPARTLQTVNHAVVKNITGKTIVLPNWDQNTCYLLTSVLKREGVDAVLMKNSNASVKESLKYNSGQCLPLNAITQGFVDCIRSNQLTPANTVLWMVNASSCSLKFFPHQIKTLLQAYGNGIEKAGVYTGHLSFSDFSARTAANAYFAYMFGGMLTKMGCKLRPYEKEKGATDNAVQRGMEILSDAFLHGRSKEAAVTQAVAHFEKIDVRKEQRPKVALFGDLYLRDNDVMNQSLMRYIEDNGGEVVTTPFINFARMIAPQYFKKWFREGLYLTVLSHKALQKTMQIREKHYYFHFNKIIQEPLYEYNESPEKILGAYNIKIENAGESLDNILKVFYTAKHHPDLALFVQTSPSFCCPSLVTEAMAPEIEKNTGVPVVSITYDGTGGNKNDAIIPYLAYPRKIIRDRPSIQKSINQV